MKRNVDEYGNFIDNKKHFQIDTSQIYQNGWRKCTRSKQKRFCTLSNKTIFDGYVMKLKFMAQVNMQ